MSRIAVVTDSTADLPPSWATEHSVIVVPLTVAFGAEVFRDGLDIDNATFYRRLGAAATLPRTSQPAAGEFLDVYRRLSADHDHIISVHIGSEYSGTLSSARAGAELLHQEDPSAAAVHLVDSHTTSGGLALMVSAASRGAAVGEMPEDIVARLQAIEPKMRSYFTLTTLEYFRRGGRIGAAEAFAGSVLQVRPIMTIGRGQVGVAEKVRTTSRARSRLLEIFVREFEGRPVRLAVVHAADPEAAADLLEKLKARLDCRETMVVEFGAVIGTHGGAGALGVGGYPDD